jgi:transcriptional regulator with XRE-family HTH domain
VVRQRTTATIRQVGARIRAERQACGLSQEEAAGRAQIGYKHWQEIEGGRGNPTLKTLVRVAEALDVSLCKMFCGTSKPAKKTPTGKARADSKGNRHPRRPASRSGRSA